MPSRTEYPPIFEEAFKRFSDICHTDGIRSNGGITGIHSVGSVGLAWVRINGEGRTSDYEIPELGLCRSLGHVSLPREDDVDVMYDLLDDGTVNVIQADDYMLERVVNVKPEVLEEVLERLSES